MHYHQRSNRFRPGANAVALAKSANHGVSRRRRGAVLTRDEPFSPPETWYEAEEAAGGDSFRVVTQLPGEGYRHAVTAAEVRTRLNQLPAWMLQPLEVVQLSRMTRKKETAPCYGMQWGSTLYLYPIEHSLTEYFDRPPKPIVFNEARMFGGRWEQLSDCEWQLAWTAETLRDFYLNNILMHELGHLLDERNTGYVDRERYAEWFAIEYGYRASRRRAQKRRIRRRHHSS